MRYQIWCIINPHYLYIFWIWSWDLVYYQSLVFVSIVYGVGLFSTSLNFRCLASYNEIKTSFGGDVRKPIYTVLRSIKFNKFTTLASKVKNPPVYSQIIQIFLPTAKTQYLQGAKLNGRANLQSLPISPNSQKSRERCVQPNCCRRDRSGAPAAQSFIFACSTGWDEYITLSVLQTFYLLTRCSLQLWIKWLKPI